MSEQRISLAHGSGGVLSRRLLEDRILSFFDSPLLAPLADSAHLDVAGGRLAFTTDTYVVDPPFFPGGDIGKLAVCGTVNDLAVTGALPKFLSCALVIEEGFALRDLDRVLESMQESAQAAGVEVVTGDTKVVPKGKGGDIYINTAGVGMVPQVGRVVSGQPAVGHRIIVSGNLGDHQAAVLARREGLNLETSVESDCAPLTDIAQTVLESADEVSFMRDITRGGLATVLNESVTDSEMGVLLRDSDIPVRQAVRSLCEILGLDPLYLACEGRLVATVDEASAGSVCRAVQGMEDGSDCVVVGEITDQYPGKVACETAFGTRRLLQMLSGEQLPRIC